MSMLARRQLYVPPSTGRIYDRNRFMRHRYGTHSTNREESIYDCERRERQRRAGGRQNSLAAREAEGSEM